MSETLLLKARGLSRYADSLSARPEGSLNQATNIVIDQPNLFSPRRGFEKLDGTFPKQALGIIPYLDNLLIFAEEAAHTDKFLNLYTESAGTLTPYSGYTSTLSVMRHAEAAGSLFLTGNSGVSKLAGIAETIVESGIPEALGGTGASTGSTGFVLQNYSVGYRVLWGYKDANEVLILGAPSNQIRVVNTEAGARDIVLSVQVPDEIISDVHFIQVYRTPTISGVTTEVGDESRLVNEEFFKTYTTITFPNSDVSTAANTITKVAHGFITGTAVTLTSAGTLPTATPSGLSLATNYYVIKIDADTFKLAYSASDAFEGTAIDITAVTGAGTIVHTMIHNRTLMSTIDQTPDELLEGALSLYTNSTRESITQANYQPPNCSDLSVFNNHMFFSDLSYKHKYSFQLLATGTGGATGGLILTDTVTIAGLVYTATAAESQPSRQFLLSNTSTPATDIRLTAESLVRCINAASTTVYAYYDSQPTALPGLIRIELRDYADTAASHFHVLSTMAVAYPNRTPFSPDITVEKTSTAETFPNRLAFSKYGEYEAVPLPQYFDVGTKTKAIKRIVALRDSLFIIKEDGIWRMTGTSSSNFSVDAFDTTTKIIAPSSIVVLNNLIYGLFDQGVCTLSESGVSLLSRDIEGDLRKIVGSALTALTEYTFAASYESDRKYLLWVPQSSLDTYATICYVYNTLTSSWTTYDKSGKAAVVNPYNDRLYLSTGEVTYLSKERKAFNFTDFCDEQVSQIPIFINGASIQLTTLTGVAVGDIYYEASDKFARISSITSATNTITCDTDLEYSVTVAKTFTAAVTDILTVATHYYATGLQVRVSTSTTLPAGLTAGVDYYVVKIDANTFKLSTSKAGAISGSGLVDITTTGTGTHTITPQIEPEVRTAYNSTIEWNAVHLNSPAHLKHFYEAMFLTSKDFKTATASFKSNLSGSWSNVEFTGGTTIGLWGLFTWGSSPWGGDTETLSQHRTYVPRDKQRAAVMYIRLLIDTAFAEWELSGLELTYRDAGQRGTRT